MSDGSVPKLMQRSIDNNLIKGQKDITMTLVRDQNFQFYFCDVLSLSDGHGKEEIVNEIF